MPKTKTGEATDLLGGLSDDTKATAPGEVVDLLDSIDEEDDAEPWIPEEAGEGVQGTVLKLGKTKSDFTPEPIPVVTIAVANGDKVRVTGFQSVLRREIEDADPQPGDTFAVKYFGQKAVKKGTGSYHHFKVAVSRGTAPATRKTPF